MGHYKLILPALTAAVVAGGVLLWGLVAANTAAIIAGAYVSGISLGFVLGFYAVTGKVVKHFSEGSEDPKKQEDKLLSALYK